MHYIATADTDIGISKKINQDSMLIKYGEYKGVEIMMAIVCDGMGGLAKGEVASATLIKAFSKWFDEQLPFELDTLDMAVIGNKWSLLLKEYNNTILRYGNMYRLSMGTTFTGILFVDKQFVVAHVGDSRLYKLDSNFCQMTEDHTFVAKEIKEGRMTPEQARTDKRRNMLLQCVGASDYVQPQILTGIASPGTYLICSDGFRHENTPEEIYGAFNPAGLTNKAVMHRNARHLIEQAKSRNERDNISVLLVKAE